jgi:hypothetical protein
LDILGDIQLPAPEFKVGEIYYMLQYLVPNGGPPLISSYEYRGTVDGKPDTHFFKATGLSDVNVFLETAQLNGMVDIGALKKALRG